MPAFLSQQYHKTRYKIVFPRSKIFLGKPDSITSLFGTKFGLFRAVGLEPAFKGLKFGTCAVTVIQ